MLCTRVHTQSSGNEVYKRDWTYKHSRTIEATLCSGSNCLLACENKLAHFVVENFSLKTKARPCVRLPQVTAIFTQGWFSSQNRIITCSQLSETWLRCIMLLYQVIVSERSSTQIIPICSGLIRYLTNSTCIWFVFHWLASLLCITVVVFL